MKNYIIEKQKIKTKMDKTKNWKVKTKNKKNGQWPLWASVNLYRP